MPDKRRRILGLAFALICRQLNDMMTHRDGTDFALCRAAFSVDDRQGIQHVADMLEKSLRLHNEAMDPGDAAAVGRREDIQGCRASSAMLLVPPDHLRYDADEAFARASS